MTDQQHHTEAILSSDLLDDGPCLENMSALAFAVLDAYMSGYGWLDSPTKKDCCGVAAALEAVTDQVVPADPCGNDCCITQCEQIRSELLAIAAELKDQ